MLEVTDTVAQSASGAKRTLQKQQLLLAWESVYLAAQSTGMGHDAEHRPRGTDAEALRFSPARATADPAGSDERADGARAAQGPSSPAPDHKVPAAADPRGGRGGQPTQVPLAGLQAAAPAPASTARVRSGGLAAAPRAPAAPVMAQGERATAWIARTGSELSVWLRLPVEAAGRGETLLASLRATLAGMGFRLAKLTINGETVGAPSAHPGPPRTSPESLPRRS